MSAAGLLGSLPAPTREHVPPHLKQSSLPPPLQPNIVTEPPPYASRERRAYIPRRPSDFGDGGAFPEVRRGTHSGPASHAAAMRDLTGAHFLHMF